MDLLDNPVVLFEEAIQALHRDLPVQTPFEIPKKPLVCITRLLGRCRNIRPFFSGNPLPG